MKYFPNFLLINPSRFVLVHFSLADLKSKITEWKNLQKELTKNVVHFSNNLYV